MAGRGPAPKPASTRARRNAQSTADRVILITPAGQPDMPDTMPGLSDNGERIPWPVETGVWWNMWAEHPLAAEFTASDWLFLKDTAVLHGRFWYGDFSVAGELRLRVAKFGATPEDRARLRVQFAVADKTEAEAAKSGGKQPAKKAKKRPDPRAHLTSVS
jgi:hypothetical protein